MSGTTEGLEVNSTYELMFPISFTDTGKRHETPGTLLLTALQTA